MALRILTSVLKNTHLLYLLFFDQIFWDPDQEWLFTEEKIIFSSNDYNIRAEKMDADRSFKLLKTGKLDGSFLFEDQQ